MVLAIEDAVFVRPLLRVVKLLEIGDALPCVVEFDELGVRSPCGRCGSDLTFESTEEVEEVPDLLRGVVGRPDSRSVGRSGRFRWPRAGAWRP